MSDDLIDILSHSKLFSGFSKHELKEVVTHLDPKVLTLKSGERLYKRDDKADRCWLIQSGALTVKRASLRTPFRQMLYNKGAITGIQGLADPGSARSVTMISDGDSELVEITHEGISRLDKDTQIKLWRNVSRILLRKLSVCLSRESLDR